MLSTTDFEKLLFLYKTEGKNMMLGHLTINSNFFSFISNPQSGTLRSVLFIWCGHQLDTNKKLRRP
jgi:hypothetical protein